MLDLRHTRTRMATSMDADSEVLFKEKREEKGINEGRRPEEGTVRNNVGSN